MLRWPIILFFAAPLAVTTNAWADTSAAPENAPEPRPAPPRTRNARADRAEPTPGSPTSYHGEPFTLDGSFGWESADLTTFQSSLGARSFTANIIPAALSGPAMQFGFGARLYSLTVGVRGGVAWLGGDSLANPVELYSVDAEVGLKLPFDKIEVSLVFAGGYSVIGGLSDLLHGLGEGLDVDGANLRLALGVDYYFSRYFSVGARGSAEVLFLARRGVALRDLPNQVVSFDAAQNALLAGSGSTVGTALSLTAGPAVHF